MADTSTPVGGAIAPAPGEDAEPIRPGADPPAPPTRVSPPAASNAAPVAVSGPSTTLAVVTPWNANFDSQVEGVPVISPSGTAVPTGSVDAVLAAAERAGVLLETKE